MFADENQSHNLNCSICEEIYDDPKILPCGETLCRKCIPKMIEKYKTTNVSQLKCLFCKKIHEITKAGFPSNKIVVSLINETSRSNYLVLYSRSKKSEILKNSLKVIKNENKKLKQSIINPAGKVDDFCSFLETKIQHATEVKIQQINDMNEKLLNEIRQFKKNCNRNLDKDTKLVYERTIETIDRFYEKWDYYLQSPEQDDNELIEAIQKSRQFQTTLIKSIFETENIIFSGKILEFDENERLLNANTLGNFIYKNKTIPSFNDLDTIDLRKNFKDQHSACKKIKLTILENGHYVIAYFSTNKFSKLLLIDKNYNTIKEKNESTHSAGFFINYFKLMSYKNLIVLYSWMSKSYMKVFDEHLFQKAHYPNFEGYFTAITFDDSNIICLDSAKSTLYIYDWNIKLQLTLRTNNVDLNFHIPANTTQIECFDSKFFLRHKTYISVINQNDGKLIRYLNGISATRFLIDRREKYLIAISDDLKKLVYFTFEGEIIYENEMTNFPDGLKYFIDHRGGIIFFDDVKAMMFK